MMYSESAIEPKVFDGPPPQYVTQDPVSGDYVWICECGKSGISSDRQWANSDVNRHRSLRH